MSGPSIVLFVVLGLTGLPRTGVASGVSTDPDRGPIVLGPARFSVMARKCIRLEYSTTQFVDAPSLFAERREGTFTDFRVSHEKLRLVIDTDGIRLVHEPDGSPIHPEILRAEIPTRDGVVIWTPGTENRGTHGFTRRGIVWALVPVRPRHRRWSVVGPFAYDRGSPLSMQPHYPEKYPEADGYSLSGGTRLKWQPIETDRAAVVDLRRIIGGDDLIAYARARIASPAAQEILFLFKTDDGARAWLNGEQIYEADLPRPLSHPTDRVATRLEMGEKVLLLEVAQLGGGWEFRVAIETILPVEPG